MSLDPKQLLEYVVRPALSEFQDGPVVLSSGAAEQLVMITGAQESKLRWLKQVGPGPAMGLWQMEPATFYDLRDRFIKTQPYLWNAFGRSSIDLKPEPIELAYNLKLAAVCCRIRYFMSSMPLPKLDDIEAMAHMWKVVYNTAGGDGKESDFIHSWETIIAPANLKWRRV
jgi:hypothetical protein